MKHGHIFRRAGFAVIGLALGLSVARADTNFTDLWWNPAESGWGTTFTQEKNGPIFSAMYVYDAAGKPVWVTGIMDPKSSNGPERSYEGNLYEVTGGTPLTQSAFNGAGVASAAVGTMQFVPDSPTAGTMTYVYKGTSVSKKIERFTVSPLSWGATAAGMPYRAIMHTRSNGACSATFDANTTQAFSFRSENSVTSGATRITFGQCDAGSTTSCPVSAPVCTFTSSNPLAQKGSVMSLSGNLECTVGGSNNPFSGGKAGTFRAEFRDLRTDDNGISGKLFVTDDSCSVVNSVVFKHSGWVSSCTYSGNTLTCSN